MSSGASPRVGLLDHMGLGNLGDAATQQAVIQNLRRRHPGAEIVGFSLNPDDTEARHGIRSFPIRRGFRQAGGTEGVKGGVRRLFRRAPGAYRALHRTRRFVERYLLGGFQELAFLLRSFRAVRECDRLVISGGGQMNEEWGGGWGMPYTLFKWALLARSARVPLVFVSVGVGTVRTRLGKYFLKRALLSADYRSFRDDRSRLFVEKLGVGGENLVLPDLAFSLEHQTVEGSGTTARPALTVGIGPIPYCDPSIWWEKDEAAYRAYTEKLRVFVLWLLQRKRQVRFLAADRMDRRAIRDIRASLGGVGQPDMARLDFEASMTTVDELLAAIAKTDLVVSSRFHGVVLSILLNKPVVALSYHEKIANLMDDMGQGEYCLDIGTFQPETLMAKVAALERNQEQILATLRTKTTACRIHLEEQYVRVFG